MEPPRTDRAAVTVLIGALLAGLLAVSSIILYGDVGRPETWLQPAGSWLGNVPLFLFLPVYFLFFAIPCGAALVLLAAVREPPSAVMRLLPPVAITVFLLTSPGFAPGLYPLLLHLVFLWFLPVWAVFPFLGVVRLPMEPDRLLGATVVLAAVWRPLHGSIPDFADLLSGPGGRIEPYSVESLLNNAYFKILLDVLFVGIGLYIYFRGTPGAPVASSDPRPVTQRLSGRAPERWWIAIGLGALAWVTAVFVEFWFRTLIEDVSAVGGGTDDTDAFLNMTPWLVLLLSFAAGMGEELVFRGVIQTRLELGFTRVGLPPWVASFVAITVAAVLFGFVHAGYGNLAHVIGPFLFGMAMGYLYRIAGLLAAVYAHTAVDILAFGNSAVRGSYPWLELYLAGFFWLNLLGGVATGAYMITRRILRRKQPPPAEPRIDWQSFPPPTASPKP